MTNQPPTTQPEGRELFDLAARLLDLEPVDLLRVRLEGATLIVLLATGQKYRIDVDALAGSERARLHQIAARIEGGIESIARRRGEAFPDAPPEMLRPYKHPAGAKPGKAKAKK